LGNPEDGGTSSETLRSVDWSARRHILKAWNLKVADFFDKGLYQLYGTEV
jgi:hypothetical protein